MVRHTPVPAHLTIPIPVSRHSRYSSNTGLFITPQMEQACSSLGASDLLFSLPETLSHQVLTWLCPTFHLLRGTFPEHLKKFSSHLTSPLRPSLNLTLWRTCPFWYRGVHLLSLRLLRVFPTRSNSARISTLSPLSRWLQHLWPCLAHNLYSINVYYITDSMNL